MSHYLLIAIGSALGGGLRGLLGIWLSRYQRGAFPLAIWLVNLSGSFLLGVLLPLLGPLATTDSTAYWMLVVGFCGSYTTVSTFALQTVTLARDGHNTVAAGYVAASVAGCLLALLLGLAASMQVFS